MAKKFVKYTEKEIKQIETLAGYGLTLKQIAAALRSSYPRLFKRVSSCSFEQQPEVREAYQAGRAKALATITQTLFQKALSGDNAAMFFYLKCQFGWLEVKPKQEIKVEHTFKNNFEKMSPNEKKMFIVDKISKITTKEDDTCQMNSNN